jgi:hypothetical protein
MGIVKSRSLRPNTSNKDIFIYYGHKSYDSFIILDKSEYKIYKEFTRTLLDKPHDMKFGEKIYLSKTSNISRHKIKEYFHTNKLNKTSKLNQSNTIILSKQHLQELDDILNTKISLKEIYFFELKDNDYIIKHTTCYDKSDLNDGIPFCLIIDKPHNVTTEVKEFLQDKNSKELYVKQLYRQNNIIEIFSYIEYVLKNPHVNIIFDEDLIEVINGDGFELDNDYLSTLDDMFNSKSQDNINLALEMLSNVNIEKHSLTIALFLNKHKNKFIWGSGLSITRNSSFKSIIKYFKSKNINFELDWRSFSINLYKLHKDNPENLKIIQEFIHQNINMYLRELGGEYLQVDNLSLALSK